jgi:DNA-binding transcriptional LysR family regulator
MNNIDICYLVERMMELSDLHLFRTVVEAGGVTRAAEKLNRVQSNVTTRVRRLEEELGVELFIRAGKKLHLSPAGKVLLDYAGRLLDLAAEARDSVHDTTPRGMFRLGSMESTASMRLPAPLSEYCRRYPDVKLELRTGNCRELSALVLHGEIDAALTAGDIPDSPFEKIAVFEEEMVLVAAAGHPPIRSPRDALSRTVLVFENGCAYRQRLEDWFSLKGEMPERLIEMSSYHAILGCAVVGMGVALVPRMVLGTFPERKRLSVHPLPQKLSRATTWLLWRKGARSPKLDALIELLAPQNARPAAVAATSPRLSSRKNTTQGAAKAAPLRPQ